MAIYFFEDQLTGLIKIGRSRDVASRVKGVAVEVQSESLRVIGILKISNPAEKQLHRRFAHLAKGHEWFSPSEDLYRFVLANAIIGLPSPSEQRSTAKYIYERLSAFGSPHAELMKIILRLYEEVRAERSVSLQLQQRCDNTEAKFNKAQLKNDALEIELNNERIYKGAAEQRLARLEAAEPTLALLARQHRELADANSLLTRERDRLLKANEYLGNRNMQLSLELKQFLMQVPDRIRKAA